MNAGKAFRKISRSSLLKAKQIVEICFVLWSEMYLFDLGRKVFGINKPKHENIHILTQYFDAPRDRTSEKA